MKPVSDGISRITPLKDQRGAVVVEMAIVLPLFAILLLGVFEFGSIAHDHQALQNAAREGARFSANKTNWIAGSTDPTVQAATLARIQQEVVTYLQGEKITVNASDVTVDQNYPIAIPGRSEEHTSELQSHHDLVCRLLLEKKKKKDMTSKTRRE